MHDVPSSAANRAPVKRSTGAAPAQQRRRLALLALGALTFVLAIAWFDGGEEPIHVIAQRIAPPVSQAL